MLTQSDNAPMSAPTNVSPITPDEDGVYTCDICSMKVRVGCGGSKNFLQHRGSVGCLRAAKKDYLKPKASQTKTIHSYFTKATQGRTSQGTSLSSEQNKAKNGVQNGVMPEVAPKATPHPKTPSPTSELLREPLGPSLEPRTSARPDPGPDAHALALLASVNRAARELPSLVPEAEEHDAMARVVLAGGPEDASEAWEHLDRELNRLLGYGVDIEEIAQRVRRGPLGVEGLTQYINGFVVNHGITGVLLEGKLERLSKAIELVVWSVLI